MLDQSGELMKKRKGERNTAPRNRREREAQLDAFAALKLMRREGLSARHAAKAEGTTVRKIRKYVGSALRKRGNDYVARPADRIVRPMVTVDARGTRHIEARSSKAASEIGKHWNAIDDALKGKPAALKKFRGKKIPGTKVKFLTNLKAIRRLQDFGLLENLKDIYWHGRKR